MLKITVHLLLFYTEQEVGQADVEGSDGNIMQYR